MITSYKGRKLEIGQLVKVYYNLHDGSFSIMDKKTRLVYGHGNNILIKNPSFEVNEKERQKVISKKCKQVHAYVVGRYAGCKEMEKDKMEFIYYNPYETSQFMVGQEEANNKNFQTIYLENKKTYGKN